jgi:hypothetical protein
MLIKNNANYVLSSGYAFNFGSDKTFANIVS